MLATANSIVSFPAGTMVTRQGGGAFAFYKMTAQPFTLDASIPATDLDGSPLATLQLGIPGLDLSFDKPVTVSMAVGSAYDGYRLSIQSLTEGGDAWANEATCVVHFGWVEFTVSHATKFGATVTIIGKGFGTKSRTSFVKFGATKCSKHLSWSKTRVRCRVPTKAEFGRVKVTVRTQGGTSNPTCFQVKR